MPTPVKEPTRRGQLEAEFAEHRWRQKKMNKLEDAAFHPLLPNPDMAKVVWQQMIQDLQIQNSH